jgi:hypothetical protein
MSLRTCGRIGVVADPDDKPTAGEVAVRMATHALVAGATLPLGAPGAMIGAAGLVLFDAAAEADKRVWSRFNGMAQDSVSAAGMTLDEFRAWATQDDGHLLFLRDLVATSLATLDEQKVTALGRVLTANLTDDAQIDESILVVRALRDLESAHIRALHGMLYNHPDDGTALKGGTRILSTLRWSSEAIGKHNNIDRMVLHNVLATLERHGLISQVEDVNVTRLPTVFIPTEFGMTCINYLLSAPDAHVS